MRLVLDFPVRAFKRRTVSGVGVLDQRRNLLERALQAELMRQKLDVLYAQNWPDFLKWALFGWQYAAKIDCGFTWEPGEKYDDDPAPVLELIKPKFDVETASQLRKDWIAFGQSVNSPEFNSIGNLNAEGLGKVDASNLTIVIAGAGPVGLYLAASLKAIDALNADVVIIDNRLTAEMTRPIFTRDWVTIIQKQHLAGIRNPEYAGLVTKFGNGDHTGLHISQIEEVLYRQCVDLGVIFASGELSDYPDLVQNPNSVVFDATGGRMETSARGAESAAEQESPQVLEIPDKKFYFKFKDFGVTRPGHESDDEIGLIAQNQWRVPTTSGAPISNPLIKLSGLPVSIIDRLMVWGIANNNDNRFYIWPGKTKRELNESLILCNLTEDEFAQVVASSDGAQFDEQVAALADPRFGFLVKIAAACRDAGWPSKFEAPFRYTPYILEQNSLLRRLGDVPVYPVGDAIFSGNPKVGNGLTTHLNFINLIRSASAS